jgi:hypothetical protein
MTLLRSCASAAIASIALLVHGAVGATAQIGGVISTTFSEAGGACNQTALVPLTTAQDTFALNLAAPCAAGSAGGTLKGDAATGTVGLKVNAAGTGFVSSQVSLIERWTLTPPAGTAIGTYAIPISLHIDGTVTTGARAVLGGPFLTYNMTVLDIYSSLPGGRLDGIGAVTSTGPYSKTFSGPVNVRYFGPGSLVSTVEIDVQMSVAQLATGTIDFYNTAFAALTLPPGWTAVTSSGLPVVGAVPEPATVLMMVLGMVALALRGRMAGAFVRRRS